MKRDSFIFYKSFYNSIKELDPKDQVQIYDAIFQYQFEGKEIELKGVCKSIFTLIIPQLEANNKRYINGKKGGAPKGNQNATKKQSKNNLELTKKQPNVNVNVNENDNDNVNIYGEFKNVKLKKEEYEKLEKNNLLSYIDKLSSYIASKGKRYKSHYATILTWARKDKPKEQLPEWFNQDIKKQKNENEDELKDMLKEFE